ncbi:hypothetical protein CGCTS75_v014792 [Colletotrichum tropicale]|nr:hypothetical protein CGCTS75_v014792 [Colletotrichum tropicale]
MDDWVSDSTVAGKRAFLDCYFTARTAAITAQNIKAGWKWAGLWLVSLRRPLSNALVSKASSSQLASQQIGSQQWDEAVSVIPWSTPHQSADLRHQLHLLSQLGKDGLDTHTIRHLSRKVQKGYDNQASRLAILEQQVKALQAQLDTHRRCKRKKVPLSPNSTFASIEHIRRAQIGSSDAEDITDESSVSELSSAAESCIWVGGRAEE